MAKVHWLALSSLPGVGAVTMHKLVERFGSVEAVFDSTDSELLAVSRITPAAVEKLRLLSLDSLEEELMDLEEKGIRVVSYEDEEYPANLAAIHDAPPVLFIRGEMISGDAVALAIVGTRSPSDEAAEFAQRLGREMAERGLTIVSGLAIGIETAAHTGALEAESGRTLAVLGSGLRRIHPKQNVPMAAEIASRGAILSEVAPDTGPLGSHLMARDRIVTGLALATVVVEANVRSGSVNAGSRARRQGRLLFAAPGSPGTDGLIAEGAEPMDPEELDMEALSRRIRDETVKGNSSGQMKLF